MSGAGGRQEKWSRGMNVSVYRDTNYAIQDVTSAIAAARTCRSTSSTRLFTHTCAYYTQLEVFPNIPRAGCLAIRELPPPFPSRDAMQRVEQWFLGRGAKPSDSVQAICSEMRAGYTRRNLERVRALEK